MLSKRKLLSHPFAKPQTFRGPLQPAEVTWRARSARVKRAEYPGAFATAKRLKAVGLAAAGSRYAPPTPPSVFLGNKRGISAAATVVVS